MVLSAMSGRQKVYKKKIGRSTLLLFSYRRPYLKTKTIILFLNKRKYVILYIRISQRKE